MSLMTSELKQYGMYHIPHLYLNSGLVKERYWCVGKWRDATLRVFFKEYWGPANLMLQSAKEVSSFPEFELTSLNMNRG